MSTLLDYVNQHYDNMAADDLDASLALFDRDVETVTPGGTLKGVEEFRGLGETFKTAMSDMRHEIVRSFEVGDTIVVEAVFTGRHTGPMATPDGEIPATGNAVSFPFADFLQFRDGRCVSHRIYWDNVALMAQLGALS
jgi:ketosteroid isomerase-like protein